MMFRLHYIPFFTVTSVTLLILLAASWGCKQDHAGHSHHAGHSDHATTTPVISPEADSRKWVQDSIARMDRRQLPLAFSEFRAGQLAQAMQQETNVTNRM